MALAEKNGRTITVDQPRPTKKRRRPSGEPPPLPRHLASGKVWLALSALAVVSWIGLFVVAGAGPGVERFEISLFDRMTSLRTDWLTDVARGIHALGSDWATLVTRWTIVAALLVFKRFRHMFVFIGSVLGVGLISALLAQAIARPRPLEVAILGHWEGSSHPSRPVAALAVTLIGIAYTLIPPGKSRSVAKWVTGVAVGLLALSRLYLAVDHPTDIIAAVIIGVSIPLIAFRVLTPNSVFPVSYSRHRAAHLDIEGARGDAIRNAIEQQIGVSIIDIEHFGLGGSAGSTPLKLVVAGEPAQVLFGKLYAQTHLRADRWYKLGRTLLYGRLEDESSFSTVRRLIQYEDYLLRIMRDARLPTPRPFGIVEITPEREYLLLTDFVAGAKELLDAEVTDEVIDQALEIVRRLWDEGLAHRDVKPSNLLVAQGEVHLIDVAFGEVRCSPWRQAVDLANMMLVLALRTDAERVYRATLRYFTADEISEAFAATRGMTIPSQTKALLKRDSRDLLAEFRALAPPSHPISIQRWSWRRLGVTLSVVIGGLVAATLVYSNIPGAGLFPPPEGASSAYSGVLRKPECGEFTDPLLLIAQAVPTASQLPCVDDLPVGWSYAGSDVVDGRARIFLDSDRAGFRAVNITLTASCDVTGATAVPSDEVGVSRLERVTLRQDRYAGTRYYVFSGGCVTYEFDFSGVGRTGLADEASVAMSFFDRATLVDQVEEQTGLHL